MFRSRVLRPVAGVVIVTFTALTLQPLTAAAQLPSAPKRQQASSDTGEERFSRTLNEIHEILKEVVPQAAMPHKVTPTVPTAAGKPGEKVLQAVGPKMRLESERAKPLPGVDVTAKVKTLRGKYKELKSLEAEVSKGFKETEKHIRDKNLPAEILARHEQAVAEYEKRKAEFGALMQAVETAADGKGELQSALANLGDFMAKYPNAKTHTPTDPNNLPWGSPKPVTRAPYTSPAQFRTSRLFGDTVKVAQAGSISGISLPSTVLPTTPMPEDTAPTEDVQITQAIRDLATSLGNNPVKIYNWVRNNIQFVPSYGSIQGSDMTLQTKRGNSFDTASLLIALLRAANVPSRYVYGTIEVPADRAMNWVGGVTVPEAAQNLMGQGGIPNVGVGFAGQIRSIRLEHVWVEAFVDYVPSRGAVNRNPNTWVPLDASFKQYQFTQGMDIKTNVPFDAQSLVTQIQQGAILNEAEGSVRNVNQTLVKQAITNYQTQVADFVNAQKPNATIGDVVGTQTIVQEDRQILLGTLPYKRIATGAKFQTISDNLRWKFQYNLYASDFNRATDSPFIGIERATPSLAGKKTTLSFSPATATDEAVINSFLPQPHPDGTPNPPSELPRALPGYLIRLVPELRIDGQLVATGPAVIMGTELVQNAMFWDPARGWQSAGDNRPVAGEYVVTVLDLQNVSTAQLQGVKDRLRQTKNSLQAQLYSALTKEQVTGDVLFAIASAYFAAGDAIGSHGARASLIVDYTQPSFGNVSLATKVLFSFSVPRLVSFVGVVLDMDRIDSITTSKDNDVAALTAYRRYKGGELSANEHRIPENFFFASSPTAEGVSAVKALAVASAQGQTIYSVTSTNVTTVLPALGLSSDIKQEISDAVSIGKIAIVSQSNINLGGWSGAGYIIWDRDTGAGAYKISGGANGGSLIVDILAMALAALVYAFAVIVSGDALAATADQAEQATETDWTCFLGWVGLWSAALIIFYLISYGSFALLATSLLLGLIGIIGGAFLIALVLFGGFLACQRPKK